jgi:SNF2 family DNA or RNA helicase
MVEEFITELEGGESVSASNPAVKRLRLLQITGGFTTEGTKIHDEKVRKARAYLDSLLDQGESVVLYARHLAEVAAVAGAAEDAGYPTRAITGATKQRDRTAAIRYFQRHSRPQALVFQVQTGSLSIELTRAAEVVFYSLPDGWELYWQCLSRVLGINQHRPVRYSHILAHETADISVLEGLIKKEDWHRTLYKDPRRYLAGMIQ